MRPRRAVGLYLVFALVVGSLGGLAMTVTVAPPASATACTSPVRYASSSNTIYLVAGPAGGGPWTLSQIHAACPAAPLVEVDPVSQTWELSANLIVQNGQSLQLHGSGAAAPGDVNTLRIRSLADDLPTDVNVITAAYGTIDADSVTVTSWDNNANGGAGGPDTVVNLPSGAPSTDRARSFVNVESSLGANGSDDESAMTIANSTFEYLGYYGTESYGVSYKAEGCSHTAVSVCNQVIVTGSEINSVFEDNYMGTYVWGGDNMTFQDNQYFDNTQYGLDTHDVSRYLTITGNHSSFNGDHGIICSEACDHLTITDNMVDHNGLTPWQGPNPDVDIDGEVHGIMLHRGVTNSVVSGNDIFDQPNGAGVAVFDTDDNAITDNTLTDNLFGIRLSVGASGNLFSNNTITDDSSYIAGDAPQYGIYAYVGSNIPAFNPNGNPTDNSFVDDTFNFNGMGTNPINLDGAIGTSVTGSSFNQPHGAVVIEQGGGTVLSGDTFPTKQRFQVKGTSSTPGGLTVSGDTVAVQVSVDSHSRADLTNTTGQIYAASHGDPTDTVTPGGSDLNLTAVALGTTSPVTVTPTPVTVVPSAGTATATVTGTGTSTQVGVSLPVLGPSVTVGIGGLNPNGTYVVTGNGAAIGAFQSTQAGTLTFTNTPTATTTAYLVTAQDDP